MKKALIAMSGGVDSSVCAAIIKNEGFDCIGGTMRLFGCGQNDENDAKAVCDSLGMPHEVFDFSGNFEKEVICRFVDAYEKGLTPNPCIDCNRHIKFSTLLEQAEKMGCDCIVTGHYARVEKCGDRYLLKKGHDESKDQSYVLYSLTQDELSKTLLPLGALSKSEVRDMAAELGLVNATKKDSQDICFVPDGDYAKFIENYTNKKYPEGDFVDKNGKVLGRHKGMIRYTIGQRKGLGLALPHPMYVCEKDMQNNRVVLCENDKLFSRTLSTWDFNWVAFVPPDQPFKAKVKTRYKAKEAPATVTAMDGGKWVKIEFDEPQRAITAGQAAVVYIDDTVVGGGTIR